MVRIFLIYGHESWHSTVTSDEKLVVFEVIVIRSDCTGNTRLASAGKKRERKAEGDEDAHNEARSW